MSFWTGLEYQTKKAWLQVLNNSLWVSSLAISIFSAGIDGEWLSKMQPLPWMGYALNFVGDLTGEVLMYQFGKMQKQSSKNSKRWKASWFILFGSLITLWFSWLFSWRQLIEIMPDQPVWIPFVCAMFVPLMLLSIGYTQAIVESKLEQMEVKKQYDIDKLIKVALEKQAKQLRAEFAELYSGNRRADDQATYEVMNRDGATCFYCGTDMINWSRDKVHIDHFYPVAKGGTDDPFNLVVSCEHCNLTKSAKSPTENQIADFQLHLIKTFDLQAKDKVHLIKRLGLLGSQKQIAESLGVSASYVSSCVTKYNGKLSDNLIPVFLRLNQVGKPSKQQIQDPSKLNELPGNGHKAPALEAQQ